METSAKAIRRGGPSQGDTGLPIILLMLAFASVALTIVLYLSLQTIAELSAILVTVFGILIFGALAIVLLIAGFIILGTALSARNG